MISTTSQNSSIRGGDMIGQDQFVHDHIEALRAEAAEERFAKTRRANLIDAPPGLRRPGVRGTFGRALIALGRVIAASTDDARAHGDVGRAA
jgi:hypothetical protein